MQPVSKELFERWQIRKTKKQKREFEAFLLSKLQQAGYEDARAEECTLLLKSRNLIAGDPDKAKVIFTAHYDTCAVLPIPNFITPMNLLPYILYQLLLVAGMFLIAGAGAALIWLLPFSAEVLGAIAYFVFMGLLIFLCGWMMAGKPNRHTANDNTSGVIALLEAALAMPAELRDKVAFIWFDNEENGLFGSMGFAAKHKATAGNTPLINFDCVSEGDTFIAVLPHKFAGEPFGDAVRECFRPVGEKAVLFPTTRKAFYPSDQVNFRRGVGVAALKKGRLGLYMDRIHTDKDTAFDEENIRCCVETMVSLAQRM